MYTGREIFSVSSLSAWLLLVGNQWSSVDLGLRQGGACGSLRARRERQPLLARRDHGFGRADAGVGERQLGDGASARV